MNYSSFSDHEEEVGRLAKEIGFTQVSLSSEIMPMVRIVPRGYTGKCSYSTITLFMTTVCSDNYVCMTVFSKIYSIYVWDIQWLLCVWHWLCLSETYLIYVWDIQWLLCVCDTDCVWVKHIWFMFEIYSNYCVCDWLCLSKTYFIWCLKDPLIIICMTDCCVLVKHTMFVVEIHSNHSVWW